MCVLGGTKNPFRGEVGEDISNAIIKCKAHDGVPARYWNKEQQEERLIRAYNKWVERGGVWTAAAEKVCLSSTHLPYLLGTARGPWTQSSCPVCSRGMHVGCGKLILRAQFLVPQRSCQRHTILVPVDGIEACRPRFWIRIARA